MFVAPQPLADSLSGGYRIEREQPLPLEEALRLACEIAGALAPDADESDPTAG